MPTRETFLALLKPDPTRKGQNQKTRSAPSSPGQPPKSSSGRPASDSKASKMQDIKYRALHSLVNLDGMKYIYYRKYHYEMININQGPNLDAECIVEDKTSGDKYVIKSKLAQTKKSIFDEYTIQNKLKDVKIAKVFDYEPGVTRVSIRFEYFELGNLHHYLCSKATGFEQRYVWSRQITSAILFCHKKNVYHLGIRTTSFCLADENAIKLVDFGEAKSAKPEHEKKLVREYLRKDILDTIFVILCLADVNNPWPKENNWFIKRQTDNPYDGRLLHELKPPASQALKDLQNLQKRVYSYDTLPLETFSKVEVALRTPWFHKKPASYKEEGEQFKRVDDMIEEENNLMSTRQSTTKPEATFKETSAWNDPGPTTTKPVATLKKSWSSDRPRLVGTSSGKNLSLGNPSREDPSLKKPTPSTTKPRRGIKSRRRTLKTRSPSSPNIEVTSNKCIRRSKHLSGHRGCCTQ